MNIKNFNRLLIFFNLALFNLFILNLSANNNNITLLGRCDLADGLGQLSINAIKMLWDDFEISYVTFPKSNLNGLPNEIKQIVTSKNDETSKLALFFTLPREDDKEQINLIPKNCEIRIAYSMLESSRIPKRCVNALNKYFDIAVVPDPWLVKVYKDSGVRIPIYVIPCPLVLDDLLTLPSHVRNKNKFTFCSSSAFWADHKNQDILVKAFIKEFNNNPNVKLKLHSRAGDHPLKKEVINLIKDKNNISFIDKAISRTEYIKFLQNSDCYVLLSRGEGFSIGPREALSLGLPCLLSNSTAHTTICNTGLVGKVKAEIKIPMVYTKFKETCGYNFTCTVEDAAKGLREIYNNYNHYKRLALKGKEWAKRFHYPNLRPLFKTLLKPKSIKLASVDRIDPINGTLYVSSKSVFDKYNKYVLN